MWSHLKRSLANLAKRNLGQLTALVKTRLKRMQYRPGLINGYLAKTGLDLTGQRVFHSHSPPTPGHSPPGHSPPGQHDDPPAQAA